MHKVTPPPPYTFDFSTNTNYYITGITSSCGGTSSRSSYDSNTTSARWTITSIPGSDCTVTASTYTNPTSSIYTSVPTGNGSVSCPASVNNGSSAYCTITASTGYHITGVSGCNSSYTPATYLNGTSGLTSHGYQTGAISSACTVSANMAINQFTVTATPDAHSKVDSNGLNAQQTYTNNYNGSNNLTFYADTANGYHLTGVTNNCGGTVSASYFNGTNGPFIISVPFTTSGNITSGVASNCTISATSAINVYRITPTVSIIGP